MGTSGGISMGQFMPMFRSVVKGGNEQSMGDRNGERTPPSSGENALERELGREVIREEQV
jgi:hypothetical protein